MNKRPLAIAVILILPVLACFLNPAFADMVYLKDKEGMEGIIEQEDAGSLVLNVGYGRITLDKKDISGVRRYNIPEQEALKRSWNYKYFLRQEFIPEGLKGLADDFKGLLAARETAIAGKKEADKIQRKIGALENELKDLNSKLSLAAGQLGMIKPKEPQEYNRMVNDFNSLTAKIKSFEYNKRLLEEQLLPLEKKACAYINDFGLFRKNFSQSYDSSDQETKERNKPFFEGISNELNLMEEDFTQYKIDYNSSGSGIVVEAVLNKAVKAKLIVDTGATMVMITRPVADKLGLRFDAKGAGIPATLADGSRVSAYPVTLESVKVGGVELKAVPAAILESKKDGFADGLLGMSFLENFVVRIDAKNNQLLLEELRP